MTGAEASAIDQLRNDLRSGFATVNSAIGRIADKQDKQDERLDSLEQDRSNRLAVERDRAARKSSRREKLTAAMGIIGFAVGVLSTLHTLGLF